MARIEYPNVMRYLARILPERDEALREMEAWALEHNFPILDPLSAHFCYQLARISGARRVFELGSGYGYSTAWFARAVRENGGGEVHHSVWDTQLSARARQSLEAMGYADLVRYHVGEAVAALRAAKGPFDLIFNDIDKQQYPESLAVIHQKLRPGGLLLVDNLLWYGRIFNALDHEPATQAIRAFTLMLTRDPGWSTSIIPVGDGILVAIKQ
jgi:predicted O-methyltransferase YrrM